jgi:hypothetical protein
MKYLYLIIPILASLFFSACSSTLNMAYEDDLYADEENIYIAKVEEVRENPTQQDDYYDPNYSDVYESDYYTPSNETDNFRYYGSPYASQFNNFNSPYYGHSYNAWGTPNNQNLGFNYGFGYNPYCFSCGGFGNNSYGWNSYNAWGTPYNNYGYGYNVNQFGYNPYYGTYNPYYGGYNNNGWNNNQNNLDNSFSKYNGQHRGSGVSSSSRFGSSNRNAQSNSYTSGTITSTTNGGSDYSHVIPSGIAVSNTLSDLSDAKKPSPSAYKPNYSNSLSSINSSISKNKRSGVSRGSVQQVETPSNSYRSSNNSAWNNTAGSRRSYSNQSSGSTYQSAPSRRASSGVYQSAGSSSRASSSSSVRRSSTYRPSSSSIRNDSSPTFNTGSSRGGSISTSPASRSSSGKSNSSGGSSRAGGRR